MATEQSSDKSSASSWTVYDTFQDRLNDYKRESDAIVRGVGELSAARQLEFRLREVKKATSEAIEQLLPVAFGKAIERQVLASFDYLRYLSAIDEQLLRIHIGIGDIVSAQNEHLANAVKRPAPPSSTAPYILAAFSVIEDQSITLTTEELNLLITSIAEYLNEDEGEVRREARRRANENSNLKGKPLEDGVWDGIDILAAILVTMRREGLKPLVKDNEWQSWIIEYFQKVSERKNSPVSITFGGSAGNFVYMLEALGLTTLLHVPYHHEKQAMIAPSTAKRLVFERDGRKILGINQGSPNDARRYSFVLQLTPQLDYRNHIIGPNFAIGQDRVSPLRPDRVILRIPNARTSSLAGWDTLRVTWKEEGAASKYTGNAISRDEHDSRWYVEADRRDLSRFFDREGEAGGFLENDLPYFPLFQYSPRIENSKLIIELASAEDVRQIATDVNVALFGGIQGLGKRWYNDAMTELLRLAFAEQLRVLAEENVSLHLELGEVRSKETMIVLRDLLDRAKLKNISLNRGELVEITSQFGSPFFVYPQSLAPASPIGIYYRARRILSRLKLETVYVHDVELGMLVRRNPEGESVEDGVRILESHRQGMLRSAAAVPAALKHRAGEQQVWPLVLSTESLAALLTFAMDYCALITSGDHSAVSREVLESILMRGYFYPGENRLSVVVTPAIFVDFGPAVSLTGAGDFCFTAHAATAESGEEFRGAGADQ